MKPAARKILRNFKSGVFAAVLGWGAAVAQIQPETVAAGLENPWGVAFLPGGRFLVTERPGRLRLIGADGKIGASVAGLPAIAAGGQGGLLDVLADSGFEKNRTLYFCFSEPAAGGSSGNSTALARAQLSEDGAKLENLKIIFSQQPKVASRSHFGCRIVESRDGALFLTLGDRFSRKEDAQKLDNHLGKIVRIAKDGTAPRDNPFVGKAGALPEIWSYGHRNGQGATLAPDDRFWMTEHGPQGGDEINVPQAGRNYGWPVISYGQNYGTLTQVGEGTSKAGMEQPATWWDKIDGSVWMAGTQKSSIAPSGIAFYTATNIPEWQGNLFVGALAGTALWRLTLSGDTVTGRERLLADRGERVRDVRQGPDGWLYVLTDNGKLLRLQR